MALSRFPSCIDLHRHKICMDQFLKLKELFLCWWYSPSCRALASKNEGRDSNPQYHGVGNKTRADTSESINLLSSQSFSCSPLLLNRINPFQELELAVSPASIIHWLFSAWSCTQREQCIPSHLHCFRVHVPSHLSTLICSEVISHEYDMTTYFQQIFLIGNVHKVAVPWNSNWHLTGTCQFWGFLDTLPECQWRGLPPQSICHVNQRVNRKTNKWRRKTSLPCPDFLVSFIL